jgi:hypothetical protein
VHSNDWNAEVWAQVRCFNMAGVETDTQFVLTYVRRGNLLGTSVCCSSDGHPTAYLNGYGVTTPSYEPAPAYRFGPGPTLITRLGVGRYEVDYGPTSAAGVVQISAATNGPNPVGHDEGPAQCKIESWPTVRKVLVKCVSPAGVALDSRFLIHHVGPFIVG